MVTTIQLSEEAKKALEELKTNKNETFEEVILNLIQKVESQTRKQADLLIEGCKEMAEDNLRIVNEWELNDLRLEK
jgi:predicted CopG family antitoxin